MKLAFVHDWLAARAGAEKVLEAMLTAYPGAPIHTLVYQRDHYRDSVIGQHPVHTSFLERLPKGRQKYQVYLPFMPFAIEQFDLSPFEVVVSSSHAVAKGALTRADQLHVSYIHTPVRYAWDLQFAYLRDLGLERGLLGPLVRYVLHRLRLWDVISSARVDRFVANSHYVARRVSKTYRRSARVIYPPVEIARFRPDLARDDFYLSVGRLVPYKRLDLVVRAFAQLGRPLYIVGDGSERAKLEELAESLSAREIQFLGTQPDGVVEDLMSRTRGFIFAADEDFGIAPVEAQAAGAPVIAFKRGGALETVVDGVTGVFFAEQTLEHLTEAVERFETLTFLPEHARAQAERFSSERFQKEFAQFVEESWDEFRKPGFVHFDDRV